MNVVLSLYSNIRVSHVNAQEPIYYVSGSLCARPGQIHRGRHHSDTPGLHHGESLTGNDDHDRSRSMIAIIMMIDDRSMIVFRAGVSWDLFFGAYHFCSIKTVDLATNQCC